MSLTLSDALARLESVCVDVIAPNAVEVDRSASFPLASVEALAAAGLLGAVSSPDVGGLGLGAPGAARVVERIARECGSTAMVVCMHFCGVAVLEAHASVEVRRAAASGAHLSTLAFSEAGSRSHFWAPMSTATPVGDSVALDAQKSWVTSARHASAFVWSSRATTGEGSTIWLVPRNAGGLAVPGAFDGLGLRGNDSAPVAATGARIPASNRLGPDGGGTDVMMGIVLPIFTACNAACSVGLMEGAFGRVVAHVIGTRHQHLDTSLADLPTIRAYVARMRIRADQARALWEDTLAALEAGRPDAMLRVLEVKVSAGEAALEVLATGMRVCGGAAFRKEVGVERLFRDGQAASVMSPTSDQLYDFIGRAVLGLPLF